MSPNKFLCDRVLKMVANQVVANSFYPPLKSRIIPHGTISRLTREHIDRVKRFANNAHIQARSSLESSRTHAHG